MGSGWLIRTTALVVVCMSLVVTVPSGAGSGRAAARGPVSVEEARAGWIMLFDGETDFGWKARGGAAWAVKGGALEASGGGGAISTNTEFSDFELTAECSVDGKAGAAILFRCPAKDGPISADNAYQVNVGSADRKWPAGSIAGIAKAKAAKPRVGGWSTYHIIADRDHLTVDVDGTRVADASSSGYSRGTITLLYTGGGSARFRSVNLRPLNLKSIFNGKDLAGWTVVPGHKSVFSVTAEGWMNVKNGNGDLQSDSEWGDFVLHVEVISNGEHLNSGIFYRANKGLFWSGYEDQIRNQWEGTDRAKAVDYGTGGIYNRQPARKVISSDHQWFTNTLIANGLHMAVWIDGYQVSDFTDTRPVNEANARSGARTKAGVLSIQGHDPTTDLSFRNITIAELPAVKP